MQTLTEQVWKQCPPGGLFDKTLLSNIFPGASKSAFQALINKALHHKEIIRLAPGIFCISKNLRDHDPHPFVIANLINGSSYVTMESALAFHNLIPEAVYQVVSATFRRAKEMKNDWGRFLFCKIGAVPFMAGVRNVKVSGQSFAYIASPARAIADLIYMRSDISAQADILRFLVESMRIEPDDIRKVDKNDLRRVQAAIRNARVSRHLDILIKQQDVK